MKAVLTLAALVGLCGTVIAELGPQDPRPQRFRSGVDVMRIEVTVLDDGRQPVRGLTEKEFSIRVDGRPQELVAFSEVEMSHDAASPAVWVREAPTDVASNALKEPRLFVIIMDDAVVPFDAFMRKKGKDIANRVIDGLGPRDLASVVFTQNNDHAQDFTADRSLLRRAVDTFQPWPLNPGMAATMSLGVLRRTRQFLAGVPDHRCAIVYVTSGPPAPVTKLPGLLGLSNDPFGILDIAMEAASDGSRLSHVPVYAFSPAGLVAPQPHPILGIDLSPFKDRNEWLRTLSNLSGGRAALETNAPERETSRMFRELESYYALAYAPDYPMDGRYRRIEVRVNRPRTTVIPGQRNFATPTAAIKAHSGRKSAVGGSLLAAVSSPLSIGAVPLRLAAAPVGLSRSAGRDVSVAITVGVGLTSGVQPGAVEEVDLELFVFDGEGRKQILHRQQSAQITRSDGEASEYELAARIDLPPGRYNLRVAATRSSDAAAGSVFTTFTVPDFAREALTMSGAVIGRAHARGVGGRELLADLLPFAPTVEREFETSDKAGALVRVFQSTHTAAVSITLATRITDESGTIVLDLSTVIPASEFGSSGRLEQRLDLPLAVLGPGHYLLTFAATSIRAPEVRRDVRFTVRQ
jgi:VWFA-related protein